MRRGHFTGVVFRMRGGTFSFTNFTGIYGGQTMSKRKLLTILLLAFVTTLMLACAVIFTACGNNETPDDGHNTEQSGENPDDGNNPGTNPGGEDDTPGTNPDGNENPGLDEPQDIAVTSISLNKTTLTMEIGESYTLVATVSPSNATDKSIIWSSTDSSVAAVSRGKVTAKSEGAATITATAHNGKMAICTVTVNEPASEVVEVTSVSLNKTTLTMEIGESETLIATVLPADAKDKTVVWTSSAQNIATVDNGTVRAVASGTALITATTVNGKTASCNITVNAATPKITKVEGAEIDGTNIFMLVDFDVTNVPLLGKVSISAGTWRLYSDILGQNEIPTKIAAGSNGKLQNGENVFYIMLENENGGLAEVYTLTVYRSYAVTVSYYNHKNILVYSDTAYTGYEYALNYDYTTPGYTFNNWTENGVAYQSRVLWNKVSLYANMTANSYTVTLDANGGEVAEETQTVTYDASYAFPVLIRTGYTFLGWYSGDILLTDTDDETSSLWQYTDITSATAKWQINQYTLTTEGLSAAGTFTEGGTYDYGTKLTLTASTANLGYDFLGWYEGDTCLTTENVYTFNLPDKDVVLTAKYEVKTEMSLFYFNSTQTECTITGIRNASFKEIMVPNYVTEIKKAAFGKCSSLNSITLPFASISFFGSIFGAETASKVSEFIPKSLKSVTITNGQRIGDYSFYNCSGLTSITIPDSVTSIGSSAFYGCSGLTSVTIPDSVTSIGQSAFSRCSGLTNLTIPDSVTSIGYAAFSGCSGLTNLTIPDSVTSIGDVAFSGCSGLTNLTIPDSVTSIGQSAFYGCSGLTSVTIPDSVTSIGQSAFSRCSGLTNLTIPDSVTSIGQSAFSRCSGLTSVTIPDSVTDIEDRAFEDCSKLTNLTIPDSVTSIGYAAFAGCSSLASVTIPDSVTSIGWSAFSGCSSLTSITIPDSVTSIGHAAFSGCSGLTNLTIPDSVTNIGDSAFSGCSGLTNLTIPDSVTSIGDAAFSGCSGLTSIAIPDSVTSIGSSAFSGCSGLTSIAIPDSVTSIGSSAFSGCSSLASVTIPDSVTSIGDSAFENCSELTSVTIPESVKVIGKYAFKNCSGLTEIFYNAVSVNDLVKYDGKDRYGNDIYIHYDTFINAGNNSIGITVVFGDNVQIIPACLFSVSNSRYRPNITSVTIRNSVTSIGIYAFNGCSGLTEVHITDLAAWCTIEFSNSSSNPLSYAHNLYLNDSLVTDLIIPDSVTSIGDYAFYNCSRLTSVIIGNGVTSIGSHAFYNCSRLMSVTIPDSVTSIGDYAFYNCSKLTNVTIGNSVTSIEGNAFYGCSKLTNVRITDLSAWCKISFGDFDANPLYYAHNLYLNSTLVTDLVIPDGVTTIRSYAFYNCSGLTNLTIPDSVTSIGSYAFSNCSGLTSATIGNSVMSIGDYAFEGCSKLTSVTFENLNGWWLASISTSGSGWVKNRSLSSSSLSNPATAANYLKSTYCNYYWKRS